MTSALFHDFRYAARALRNAAGFTTVAVATLALGIGANTAMFGVVDALLFKPPAGVAAPGEVFKIRVTVPTDDMQRNTELSSVLSYPDFTDLRTHTRAFSALAAYARNALTVGEGTEARSQPSLLVSGSYFPMLGVRPALGRLIGPSDDLENAAVPVAVLSWDLWQRAFAGDRAVIGRSIQINGRAFSVIGVTPEHFRGTDLDAPALWVPIGTAPLLGYDTRMMRSRFASWLSVVGRLASNATREQAQASAQAALLAARDAGEAPPLPADGPMAGPPGGEVRIQIGGPGGPGGGPRRAPPPRQVRLTALGGSGTSGLPSPFGGAQSVPVSLWFLAVTGAVLLIACANVANLLLARAAKREHEIAVRLSLGAPTWRLTRQIMSENLLLAAVGGVGGLALAYVGVGLLPRVVPLPPLPPFFDARVLTFTAALTLVTTLAFGLVPAVRLTRTDLQRVLSSSGRSRRGRSLGKSALVVAQLAASLVLVVAAGLFIRSLRNVRAVDTGFAAEEVAFASIDGRQRLTRDQAEEYWKRALDRVRQLPGVRSASLGGVVPFEMNIMMPVEVPGYRPPDGRPMPAQIDFAGPEYFSTLGIAVKQGRSFTADDRESSAPVVIVNETLARRVWGGAWPIGRCLRLGGPGGDADPCMEVVGVAANARYADVTQPSPPFVYRPLAQRPRMAPPMTVLHIRATGDPSSVIAVVRRELQALDSSVPYVRVVPMMDLIAPQLTPWRTGTFMFSLFGALGLTLAAIGLYGVISFVVAQQTREIGVRLALGARRGDVLTLVLGQGMRLIAVGIGLGALVAAATTRLFGAMMYGVSALDPLVYVGTAMLLTVVGLVAIIVPARRATQVDPLVALRAE